MVIRRMPNRLRGAARRLLEMTGVLKRRHGHWWDDYPLDPTEPFFVHHAEQRGSDELEESWRLYDKLVEAMAERCREHGARLCLFNVVEAGHLAWEKRWRRIEESASGQQIVRWGGQEHPIQYDRHAERLREIAGKRGLSFVPNRRSYTRFANDPHANEEGNRRMAEDIADFLTSDEQTASILRRARTAPPPTGG